MCKSLDGVMCWFLSPNKEKAMAPHSSTLAWKIPWTEEPGELQSMGSLRVGHDWVTSLSLFIFTHWRRKWQPTPVFLLGEPQGRGCLVGYSPRCRKESDTTEWLHFFTSCIYIYDCLMPSLTQRTWTWANSRRWWRTGKPGMLQSMGLHIPMLWICVSLSVTSDFLGPMDCSLSDFSAHRILQARILAWVAIPFSKRSFWPRDQTQVSLTMGKFLTIWATRED